MWEECLDGYYNNLSGMMVVLIGVLQVEVGDKWIELKGFYGGKNQYNLVLEMKEKKVSRITQVLVRVTGSMVVPFAKIRDNGRESGLRVEG